MPATMVGDAALALPALHATDTPSPVLTGDAVALITRMWRPRFPSPELIRTVAGLLPEVRATAGQADLTEGARPYITLGPGVLEVRSKDYARSDRTDERASKAHAIDVDLAVQYFTEHGTWPDEPEPTRVITEWSRKSRANMVRSLAGLDYMPMYADPTRMPCMVTFTYSGDWVTVAPSGREVKKHMKAFRKRYERAWQEPLLCVWKLEFQKRGAPHVHMMIVPPHGTVDGRAFRQWLSLTWAHVVAHPDPDEFLRHMAAGTRVDYAEGIRNRDPRRLAVYFLKHSQFRDKEYQHRVPDEWQIDAAHGPGRFWGYWGLKKATVVVEVDQATGVQAGRTLRRWAAAQRVTRERTRPRVRGGRIIPKYAEVQGLAGAQLVESRPAPTYRKTRGRSRTMAANRGFVLVNDGAMFGVQLAAWLDLWASYLCKPPEPVGSP